jgi:apolipoprotein N-acyltransferase
MKILIPPRQERCSHWFGIIWLLLGTICALFATNGRWDLSLMAWLSPLFFLRFTRINNLFIGIGGVWLASVVALFFFFYESQMSVLNPILIGGCLIINTLLVLPYLIDRLLYPRLSLLSGLLATLIFPLGRAAFEYLNTVFVSPFGSIFSFAYTQYGNLPLLQILSITGIYGITFLMAWFASTGNWIWERHFSWPRIRKVTLLYAGLLALVLLSGSIQLAFFPPSAQTIRVAGISAPSSILQKVRQEIRTVTAKQQLTPADLEQLRSAFATIDDDLLTRSEHEVHAGAKIIVWPEAGVLALTEDETTLIARGQTLARQEGVYLEMGYIVLQYTAPSSLKDLSDRTVLVDPQGRVAWTYDKAHPVPGLDRFAPGDGKVPVVDTPYGRISNVICFDADFPDLMRQASGVDLMLVPGND